MPVIVQIADHALVLVTEDNLKRIGSRDPMILDVAKLSASTGRPITKVVITLGTEDDVQEVARLAKGGDPVAVFDYACRGWSTQPDDHLPMHRLNTTGDKQ